MTLTRLYHVPRSQVWPGSRGRQHGNVHLHGADGRPLCGRRGWYERPLEPGEQARTCPRCSARAERLGLEVPA